MKCYFIVMVLYSVTAFAQQKKVEITGSPNSNVIVGNKNTVNNIIISAPLAIANNPKSQSVQLGGNCVLKVKASGGLKPYKYKWFINNKAISNSKDSLQIYNVGLNYHNAKITVIITDSQQSIVNSEDAIIKTIQPFFVGYSKNDPYVNDTTIPKIENKFQEYLYHDSSIVFYLPKEAADKFFIVKVPSNESIKYGWYHNDVNTGNIPDNVIRKPFTIDKYTYYITVNEFAMNYRQPVTLLNK